MHKERPSKESVALAPQYRRIESILVDELRSGVYAPGQRFLTERDVCARFGVSRTTAVRALTDLVHEGRLTRVQGSGTFVAEGAVPAPASPRPAEPRLIGVVCQHLQDLHSMAILRGIATACRERDYHFLLFESAGDPSLEVDGLRRAREAGASGLLVYPVDGYENAAQFEALQRENLPLVMIDRYYPNVLTDVVVPDNWALAEEIVDGLVRLGHRRMAFIGASETFATSSYDRASGYRTGLRKHGIPFDPELAVVRPFMSLNDDDRRSLLHMSLQSAAPVTAFIAMTATVLVRVAGDLRDLNVDMQSVALASMDDLVPDTVLRLATLTAHLPSYEMGYEAARMVVQRLEGLASPPAQHVVLPATISASSTAH